MASSADQLEGVLLQMMQPDTQVLKAAGAQLSAILSTPQCVPALCDRIQHSSNASVKHIAAIYLRKKIPAHWGKLSSDNQDALKQLLLQLLVQETVKPVRRAIGGIMTSVAVKAIPSGRWNELLSFLSGLTEQSDASLREIALLVFRNLCDRCGKHLRAHYDVLHAIFSKGLRDSQSQAVRVESLRGFSQLARFVDPSASSEASRKFVASFEPIIPMVVEILKQCIAAGDQDAAAVGFELFDDLAESPVPVLQKHAVPLVQFMIEVTGNKDLATEIRQQAGGFIIWMSKFKATVLIKAGVINSVLDLAFALCIEKEEDDDDDDDSAQSQLLGTEIVDTLVLHLESNQDAVYQPAMQRAAQLLGSSNPREIRAALLVLATMAEGCADKMKEAGLAELLGFTFRALDANSKDVQSAACIALTQFTEYFQPEIMQYSEQILPAIVKVLESQADEVVKGRACTTLEVICENLGEAIAPHLSHLLQMLAGLLNTNMDRVRLAAVTAIGSVAEAAGPHFQPFLGQTMDMMLAVLSQDDDSMLRMRARATACVGQVAMAVGKDLFSPFLERVCLLVLAGFELEFVELRECSYTFFANLAQVLGADFAKINIKDEELLDFVLTRAMLTMDSDDGLTIKPGQDGFGGSAPDLSDDEDDEDDDDLDGDDLDRHVRISIKSGFLEEKCSAIACVAMFGAYIGEPMLPKLEELMHTLRFVSDYPHEDVRRQVATAFFEFIQIGHKSYPLKWLKGKPEAVGLHPNAKQLIENILPELLMMVDDPNENDMEVASVCLDYISATIKNFGPAGIQEHMDLLCKILLTIVTEQHPAQRHKDEEDGLAEHDHLVDSVTDVISDLARAWGPAFEQPFRQLFPHLLKFAGPERPASEQGMIVGCLGDIACEFGSAMVPYLERCVPLAIAGLSHEDTQCRQNAAYCIGELLGKTGEAGAQYFEPALKSLQPLITGIADGSSNLLIFTRDNATSAVAKMLTGAPGKLPLDAVVPLFLSGLPLTKDDQEHKFAYATLINLCRDAPQLMDPHAPTIVKAFAQSFACHNMSEEMSHQMSVAARRFVQKHAQTAESTLASLPQEVRQALVQKIQA